MLLGGATLDGQSLLIGYTANGNVDFGAPARCRYLLHLCPARTCLPIFLQ
jgi:hypothetical protein